MELDEIKQQAVEKINKIDDLESLEELRIKYLGRNGIVVGLFSDLVKLKGAERAKRGQELNILKQEITKALEHREKELQGAVMDKLAETEKLDVTLPGTRSPQGHLHITTAAIAEITRIFAQIGFQRVRYPEADWDHYAFEALNMPKDHPARDEWETFFIAESIEHRAKSENSKPLALSPMQHLQLGRMVLTPHTSNGQIREMERRQPPIRMINIAKCYRRQMDMSHTPMFHQFEGLLIDKNVSVTHLKGTLEYFVKAFFGPDREIRLRPFHFRFTEPSFEVDISCGICAGKRKCKLCKSGWLELGGSGMVHPNVLKAGGLNPKEWSGFAFGWGVERNYMMKAGLKIDDIRVLYNNDLNFLEQF